MRSFAGDVGQFLQHFLRRIAHGNSIFAQTGKAQNRRSKPVFPASADLLDEAMRLKFAEQTVRGRFVHARQPRHVGQSDLRLQPVEKA